MAAHELATYLVAALCFVGGCGLAGYYLFQSWHDLQSSSPAYLEARRNMVLKLLPACLLLAAAVLLFVMAGFFQG
jgi:hypothetical protein